jgi:hypothetical protein
LSPGIGWFRSTAVPKRRKPEAGTVGQKGLAEMQWATIYLDWRVHWNKV